MSQRGGGGLVRAALSGRPGAGVAESTGRVHRPTTKQDILIFAKLLKPYFWPERRKERLSAFSCFFALGASKALTIISPRLLGTATDALIKGNMPLALLLGFGFMKLGSAIFDEIQRIVYIRVKQTAYHQIATQTFRHLLSLSIHWHVNKKSGAVMKAMDRGIGSAQSLVDMLFLRLVPAILEMIVLVILFQLSYGSTAGAFIIFSSFVAYIGSTILITRKRMKHRKTMNEADNQTGQIATDAFTSIETVKVFSNEDFEVGRYSTAVARLQTANVKVQTLLSSLNLTQAFIQRAAITAVMITSALDVLAGRASVGDFVVMQTYVAQLFTPLSWLGAMYSLIVNAFSDMKGLGDLWRELPDIPDAPDAAPLRLADASASGVGPCIEFKDVWFAYPSMTDAPVKAAEAASEGGAVETASAGKTAMAAIKRRLTGGAGSDKGGQAGGGAGADGEGATAAATAVVEASNPSRRVVLCGVSFTVKPGKMTAIVGPSGSGKSTIARLLYRFYDLSNPIPREGVPEDQLPPLTPGAAASTEEGALYVSIPVEGSSGAASASPAFAPAAAAAGSGSAGAAWTASLLNSRDRVSPSGSGKQAKPIGAGAGFGAGAILIDGQDIRSVTTKSLRDAIGIVPQECVLFNDTIKFNISYPKPDAKMEEVEAAARGAQMLDMVLAQPAKWDTKVGERGMKLSGGEKQRVAIARAILKNPPILILDEATSALDSHTETQVQAALKSMRAGRTAVVVAHRLSTIRDADEIIVLDKGRVLERGSHDELMAVPGGRYAEMWALQAAAALAEATATAPEGDATAEPAATSADAATTPSATTAAPTPNPLK